jgi:hypothetical protein
MDQTACKSKNRSLFFWRLRSITVANCDIRPRTADEAGEIAEFDGGVEIPIAKLHVYRVRIR